MSDTDIEVARKAHKERFDKIYPKARDSNNAFMAPILRGSEKELKFTEGCWNAIIDVLAMIRADTLGDILEIKKRLNALEGGTPGSVNSSIESRVKALEDKPELAWRGVWREDQLYKEAELATHEGALWISKRSNMSRPGSKSGDADWRLIVKSGR